ncbi:MAG: FGGY family carbohydrate kinase [Gemmatimonadales bacterium]
MATAGPHVLAIDQGTTGTTCLVIAADGRVAGRAYREITQYYPQPGWVEHDPAEILDRTLEAAREAVTASGVVPVAIGITNQRETVVVWERAHPRNGPRAIVWQDRRTAARCLELAPHAAAVAATTGLTIDPYFSAAKIEWLLRTQGWTERARRGDVLAATIDSWLIWHLTGGRVYATDPTNASRTSLYDIGTGAWSDAMCALFGVPRETLPEVRRSSGDFGWVDAAMVGGAAGQRIPITGVAGDQQAALFGHGCVTSGEGKNTYGTGAFLLLHTGQHRPASGGGLLTTIACDPRGGSAYALEAAIFIAGAAVQWLRDGLGIISQAAETEALARSVASTDGVVFVPALTGLGAPHWEPNARGAIVGLTRGTTRAHLARAALEAMAYSTHEVLATMNRQASSGAFERLRVDGGASQNDWLMQFQADVLGVPVERPAMVEATALGAAGLAGLAAGVWPDVASFVGRRPITRFVPGAGRDVAQRGVREWSRAVGAVLHWARAGEVS